MDTPGRPTGATPTVASDVALRGEIVVWQMRRSHEVKETFERAEHIVAEGRAVATAEEKRRRSPPGVTERRGRS